MYLGNAVVPQASMIKYRMKQRLGDLRIRHILEGNKAMKDVIKLRPYIRYLRVPKT